MSLIVLYEKNKKLKFQIFFILYTKSKNYAPPYRITFMRQACAEEFQRLIYLFIFLHMDIPI